MISCTCWNIPWIQEIYAKLAPYKLFYAPDFLETQGMCNEAVRNTPCMLRYVPDNLKTQEMCNKAVRIGVWPRPF